ncbi:helix-turn-helix transcriptional regulator [Paludibaculum fermentans]|uniref:helix-turn-helix transcriptional regulator n=1 Tax=Paludibaculum fermentans TaxID=1473598 RepID=UPI003EB89803
MRQALTSARRARKWSQLELGRRIGLPQVHISAIESGKVTPRFNTLLDLVRVLDFDLLLIPRALVPAVQALVRDHEQPASEDDRPLYATEPDDEAGHDA